MTRPTIVGRVWVKGFDLWLAKRGHDESSKMHWALPFISTTTIVCVECTTSGLDLRMRRKQRSNVLALSIPPILKLGMSVPPKDRLPFPLWATGLLKSRGPHESRWSNWDLDSSS